MAITIISFVINIHCGGGFYNPQQRDKIKKNSRIKKKALQKMQISSILCLKSFVAEIL